MPRLVKSTTAASTPSASPSGTILVVDNDQTLIRVLELKFRKAGLGVTVCHDGREAIDCLKSKMYRAVVLDLMMPVVNGFDVLQAKAKTPNAATPAYVLSGMANPDASQKALKLGATKYFVKFSLPLKDIVEEIATFVLQG